MPNRNALFATLLGAGLVTACGGGSPSTPTPVATPPPAAVLPGTVWQAVSGDSGGPLASARFVLPGRTYTADASGQITLADAVPFGSELTIQADGQLDRQTLVRRNGSPVFTLWPRTNASWTSEEYLKRLVYTDTAAGSPSGGSPLRCIKRGETHATVYLPPSLYDDHPVWEEFDYGIGHLNTAIGGRVVYTLSRTPASGGISFEVNLGDTDGTCANNDYMAYTRLRMTGNEITGGMIVFCHPMYAVWPGVAAHELGHTFGLRHSLNGYALMSTYVSKYGSRTFSSGEQMSLRLLLDRPGGNRWPDDDRQVTSASRHVETIACPR